MDRRQFMYATAIALVAPAAYGGSGKLKLYSRDAYEKARASGEPLLLDFFTTW